MSEDGYLSPDLLEILLHKHESETQDFKCEQYPIDNATNEEKSEFVKDIIAFANAWKTSDAYILIGVEEVPGSRANVLGVSQHIDDAKLQQLVNSKTNVPVRFTYVPVTIDGEPVGVVRIERDQQRPIFLKKDFGKLEKETVYIRRSSSTDEAGVAEIARMGAATVGTMASVPVLEIGFGFPYDRKQYGTRIEMLPKVFRESPSPTIEELREQLAAKRTEIWGEGVAQAMSEIRAASFFRKPSPAEVRNYHQKNALLVPLGLYVKNVGQVLAQDVQLELSIPFADGVGVIEESDHPRNRPVGPFDISRSVPTPSSKTSLTKTEEYWLFEASFGKVQPQEVSWLYEHIYVSSRESVSLEMNARIRDDNLPKPIEVCLQMQISPEEIEYDPKDWEISDEGN